MAYYTKPPWDVDNTAYVDIFADTYCNSIIVYENSRAATTDLLLKGAVSGSGETTKVAGEKIEFRSHGFRPGQKVGSVKCVSIVTATMAQEEDNER